MGGAKGCARLGLGKLRNSPGGLIPRRALRVATRCPQAARQREENCRAQAGHPAGLKARAREESA